MEVVVAALITLVGTMFTATMTFIVARRTKKIGNPNGHGTIATMLEHVLETQADHTARLSKLETKEEAEATAVTLAAKVEEDSQ